MPTPLPTLSAVAEWHDVDRRTFTEQIMPLYRPAVLRGVVGRWPAVAQARLSPEALCRYLIGYDRGAETDAIMTPPSERGRIFYQADMDGFNYLRNRISITAAIGQLVRYSRHDAAPALAIQSALLDDCLPGYADANPLPLLDAAVRPRIWLGNRVVTPAHFDQSNNLACVVGGRRRFTLFPPEQVGNLYIGPLDYAPTPTPISMVTFDAAGQPDLDRFPRYRDALAVAQVAELGPGDALYIPSFWWHQVESLDLLNVLVNYWWNAAPAREPAPESPFACLLHCVQHMQDLPPEHKAAWQALFGHYVFNPAHPAEHIPPHKRGVLTRADGPGTAPAAPPKPPPTPSSR